jgi:hypothetical protein
MAVWKAAVIVLVTAVVKAAVKVVHFPTDAKEPQQKPKYIIINQKNGSKQHDDHHNHQTTITIHQQPAQGMATTCETQVWQNKEQEQ